MGCGAGKATGLGFVCFVVINRRVLSANELIHFPRFYSPPPPLTNWAGIWMRFWALYVLLFFCGFVFPKYLANRVDSALILFQKLSICPREINISIFTSPQIGCGAGAQSKSLLALDPSLSLTSVDPSPPVVGGGEFTDIWTVWYSYIMYIYKIHMIMIYFGAITGAWAVILMPQIEMASKDSQLADMASMGRLRLTIAPLTSLPTVAGGYDGIGGGGIAKYLLWFEKRLNFSIAPRKLSIFSRTVVEP